MIRKYGQKVEWQKRKKVIELNEGMNKMNENFEIKDALYYDDLIYEIKKLAGFPLTKDKSAEDRIIERFKCTEEKHESGLILSRLSTFEEELFEIIRGISKKVGLSFTSLSNISKYKEVVSEVIIELENKKHQFDVNAVPSSRSHAFVVSNGESKSLSENITPDTIKKSKRKCRRI